MTFAILALITLAGLLGPLVAWPRRTRMPILVGELAAGLLLGDTGVRRLHPDNPTFAFLAQVGFALVMFVAGTRVPVRDPALRSGLRVAAIRVALAAVGAAALGVATAAVFYTGHAALYGVLMASSSAAVVMPVVNSLSLSGPAVLQLLPQVALADALCIVALPLAIDPAHAPRAALGALIVSAACVVLFFVLRQFERSGLRHRLHEVSEQREFALELRISLVILFGLAALATLSHVSIMLAGFGFGLVITAIGEPRRLTRQLFALTEGFMGPMFFVWLGASLNLRDLGAHPTMIVLGVMLGAGAVLAHCVARLSGQPITMGVLAAAQVGVPVAAATLGEQLGVLKAGEAPALILGALICIAAASGAGSIAARRSAQAGPTGGGGAGSGAGVKKTS